MTKDFDFKHYYCEYGKYEMKELVDVTRKNLAKMWLEIGHFIKYFIINFHRIRMIKAISGRMEWSFYRLFSLNLHNPDWDIIPIVINLMGNFEGKTNIGRQEVYLG